MYQIIESYMFTSGNKTVECWEMVHENNIMWIAKFQDKDAADMVCAEMNKSDI